MFLWSKQSHHRKRPAPAPARGREVAVQKVDRIEVVRNPVTRPPTYGGGRSKLRGGGAGGASLTPRPRSGGGSGVAQGEDNIDERSSEYIQKVRKMWFHSHDNIAARPVAARSAAP